MSSAGVKAGYSLPGLRSRIAGVRIALTTTMFAVAPLGASESASASVQVSAAALVAAYEALVACGRWACVEETSTKRPPGCAMWSWKAREVSCRVRTSRSCSHV